MGDRVHDQIASLAADAASGRSIEQVAADVRASLGATRAERERDMLLQASWDAYVITGADPDGNTKWHCSVEGACQALVAAVAQLRRDYDDMEG